MKIDPEPDSVRGVQHTLQLNSSKICLCLQSKHIHALHCQPFMQLCVILEGALFTDIINFEPYGQLRPNTCTCYTCCDSGLAQRRKTSSRLLCLHHDDVCLENKRKQDRGSRENSEPVTIAGCKTEFENQRYFVKQSLEYFWQYCRFFESKSRRLKPLIHLTCSECVSALSLLLGLSAISQSQRSGCRFTGDILTSAGRPNYMGILVD